MQHQHEIAIPDTVYARWVAVRGTPGTQYDVYVVHGDGTRWHVDSGEIPWWGISIKAVYGDPQPVHSYTPGDVWTEADAKVGALVRFNG